MQPLRVDRDEEGKNLEVNKVNLNAEELAVIHKQLAEQRDSPTPFRFLFNCTTKFDLALLAMSLIAAVGSGLAFPISDVR